MDPKSVALVITFAAVAIALNAIRIPTIFRPGGFFQFNQIPIVVAFLLFGGRIGMLVGILNLAGGFALFPLGPTGLLVYPMDFLSLLIMFVGMHLASKLNIHANNSSKIPLFRKHAVGLISGATLARSGLMPFVDYAVASTLIPLIIGIKLPQAYILGLFPAYVLYNVIVSLYVVFIAYIIAAKVGEHMNLEFRLFSNATKPKSKAN